MYKIYKSRLLIALAILSSLGLLSGGILLYADVKLTGGGHPSLLALCIVLLVALVAFVIARRRTTLFLIIETDGETWIRALNGPRDVRINRATFANISYAGFDLIVRSMDDQILIPVDNTGYIALRAMVERWSVERAAKMQERDPSTVSTP